MNTVVQSKLDTLPSSPGVYFHKNVDGKIIYVGKAAVLRNRVRQYFQKSRTRDAKTDKLVSEIADIEWVEVDSEIDALFLEAELIKRYKPQYNIMLRDDKSDLYVRIDVKAEHPTVSFTRRPLDDKAEYFGPYYNGYTIKKAMRYLRRAFPYDSKKSSAKRVSLDHHIGLSPGLEEGMTSVEDYRSNLRKLMQYLRGNRVQLIRELEKEMKTAASEKNFEKAALIRNQVNALNHLRKQIVFGREEFMDISKDQGLSGLAELLQLPNVPQRIEGYDISHMSGTDTVASMVVFSNGIPDKSSYRKFKMRVAGNDDFIHMHEVVSRRFSGRNLSKWPKPDLVLIDGGKGQVNAALSALGELGIDGLPLIGLAKRLETIIVPDGDEQLSEVFIDKDSHALKLLMRIRDESHRFAVSYHTSLKRTRQTQSELDAIPGIGPATKKKLLRKFGSLRGVKNAEEADIAIVVGESKARVIYKSLSQKS